MAGQSRTSISTPSPSADLHIAARLVGEVVGPVAPHLVEAALTEACRDIGVVFPRHRGPVVDQRVFAVGVMDESESGVDGEVEIAC